MAKTTAFSKFLITLILVGVIVAGGKWLVDNGFLQKPPISVIPSPLPHPILYTWNGCDYLDWGHGPTHKGNCSNSIHCRNEED